MSPDPLNGLLILFLLAWAVGWLVLGKVRLALIPASCTALIFLAGRAGQLQAWLGNPADGKVFIVPILFLAFALWAVTRLMVPLAWRVIFTSLLVPLLVVAVTFAVVLFLLKQFP